MTTSQKESPGAVTPGLSYGAYTYLICTVSILPTGIIAYAKMECNMLPGVFVEYTLSILY